MILVNFFTRIFLCQIFCLYLLYQNQKQMSNFLLRTVKHPDGHNLMCTIEIKTTVGWKEIRIETILTETEVEIVCDYHCERITKKELIQKITNIFNLYTEQEVGYAILETVEYNKLGCFKWVRKYPEPNRNVNHSIDA